MINIFPQCGKSQTYISLSNYTQNNSELYVTKATIHYSIGNCSNYKMKETVTTMINLK